MHNKNYELESFRRKKKREASKVLENKVVECEISDGEWENRDDWRLSLKGVKILSTCAIYEYILTYTQ